MSLKEQIAADQASVFFNTDDFAQVVTINGTAGIKIIADSTFQSSDDPRIVESKIKFQVQAADLPTLVIIGEPMTINNQSYIVTNTKGFGEGLHSDTDVATVEVMRNMG